MDDYYVLLGVARFCDDIEVIRRAYRELLMFFHPDHQNVAENIALEKTQQLTSAYRTLSSPDQKLRYDAQLRAFYEAQQRANTQHTETRQHTGTQTNTATNQHAANPEWFRNIYITESKISAKKLSSRIFSSVPDNSVFIRGDINSRDIYEAFMRSGHLERRADIYGNPPHYFPTRKGVELGIGVADRTNKRNPHGRMQISVFGRQAQRYFVDNCLGGLLR